MRSLIFIISLSCTACFAFSQTDIDAQKQRLLTEIRKCDYIESYCLGDACNSYSILYQRADSLLALSTMDEALTYFNDSSYSLKYYSFLHILVLNDTIAFELLRRSISDTRSIDYQFADLFSRTRFIYLIVDEYRRLIELKYLFGGHATWSGHRVLSFPPANKRTYKRRRKELDELLSRNNIVFK